MSATDVVALLGALGLFLGALGLLGVQIANSRNAVKKVDLEDLKAKSKLRGDQDTLANSHLISEIARLEAALDRRRVEIETLFAGESNLHREMETVRANNSNLRQENSTLRDRIGDMEVTVKRTAGERDQLTVQLEKLHQAVLHNADLTQIAVDGAHAAYKEANDVNKKIQAGIDLGNDRMGKVPPLVTETPRAPAGAA